jgi:hypothetical protein
VNFFFVEKLEVENYFKIFEQEQRIDLAKTAKKSSVPSSKQKTIEKNNYP